MRIEFVHEPIVRMRGTPSSPTGRYLPQARFRWANQPCADAIGREVLKIENVAMMARCS